LKNIVLKFGLLGGLVVSALMSITIPMVSNGRIDFENGEVVGYSTMVLAFLFVFFGIKSYRDNVGGGTITFGKAFKVGLLITLVTCAMYVITWEIIYFNFLPDFIEKYSAATIAKMQKDGASATAIAATRGEMQEFAKFYANPFFNVGMTFMEIFPVGLVLTLISAGILRRKTPVEPLMERTA
jgi:hypothetical protein